MKDERQKPLIAGVERSLPLRFRRRRLNWWAELPETTIAIALQRSRFGGTHYIEVGAHPNDFVNPYFSFAPQDVSSYGFRQRADRIVPDGTELDAFNFDYMMGPAEREDRVAEVVALLAPHLLAWSTLDGLREVAVHPRHRFSMHDALRRWLGVPPKERPADVRAEFGERLVRFRMQAGLDPGAAAALTRIDAERLADAEAGTSMLYDDELNQIGFAYGIDPSLIFGGSGKVIIRQVIVE